MNTLQTSFLEVPLKNLTEIYNNEVVPRLTKKNKVIAISIAIFLMISYKMNTILRPPRKLRHIPHQSYYNFLSNFLKGKPILTRAQSYSLPLINSKNNNGLYLRPGRFGWEVQITNSAAIKHVLLRNEQFPKMEIPTKVHSTLFFKLIGLNIVFLLGERWKEQRKVANPAFHRSMPVHIFGNLTLDMFGEMEKMGATVNISDLMERWTLDAIGKAGFDFDFNALIDKDNEWVQIYTSVFGGFTDPLFFIFPMLDTKFLWMFPKRKRLHEEVDKFKGMVRRIIEEKRKKIETGEGQSDLSEENEKDLLTLMLESELKGEGKMTDTELESNLVIFFIAGHDTTALALSAAICFLAQHPEIQQHAREEAISILGDVPKDVLPTVEDTKKMSYINQVIKETLRLNGSLANTSIRVATEDCELAGSFIPKGTRLSINLYETMHSEKNWKNALEFNPDRFATDKNGAQVAGKGMTWIPFGNGARQCIGMNFSLAEQRVMLSMLLRKYTWVLPKDSIHKNGIQAVGLNMIGPKDLQVEFSKRY